MTLSPHWLRIVATLLTLCLGSASVEVAWAEAAERPATVQAAGTTGEEGGPGTDADCACLCACTCLAAQLVTLPGTSRVAVPFSMGRTSPGCADTTPPHASPRPHFRPPRM